MSARPEGISLPYGGTRVRRYPRVSVTLTLFLALPLWVAPLGACGSGAPAAEDSGGEVGPDASGSEATTCEALAPAAIFGPAPGLAVRAYGSHEGELVTFVSTDAVGLSAVWADGTSVEIQTDPVDDVGAAVREDGTLCLSWFVRDAGQLRYACGPDFVVEDALSVQMDGGIRMVEHAGGDATTMYTKGRFSSVESIQRVGQTWMEVDLYESSKSYPGGAARVGSDVLGCFIDHTGRLAFLQGSHRVTEDDSGQPVSWCTMVADGPDQTWVVYGDDELVHQGTLTLQESVGLDPSLGIPIPSWAGGAALDAVPVPPGTSTSIFNPAPPKPAISLDATGAQRSGWIYDGSQVQRFREEGAGQVILETVSALPAEAKGAKPHPPAVLVRQVGTERAVTLVVAGRDAEGGEWLYRSQTCE